MKEPARNPHGPGFSFVDTIEILEPGAVARGHKWLDPALPLFKDHFPEKPLFPGVLLIEAAAQTAGCLWPKRSSPEDAPLLFLAQVQGFRLSKPVLPNQTLDIEVKLEKDFETLAQFDAVIRVAEEAVASGKLVMSLAK